MLVKQNNKECTSSYDFTIDTQIENIYMIFINITQRILEK